MHACLAAVDKINPALQWLQPSKTVPEYQGSPAKGPVHVGKGHTLHLRGLQAGTSFRGQGHTCRGILHAAWQRAELLFEVYKACTLLTWLAHATC